MPYSEPTLVHAIAAYGHRYRERELARFDPELLLRSERAALDFFLSRGLYQGRRDTISDRVYAAAREVLLTELGGGAGLTNLPMLRSRDAARLERALQEKIGKGKVGKRRDVEMVLSALDFTDRIPEGNLVGYSVACIRQGRIAEHYLELQPSRPPAGITQVGPKIAAVYLRDVVSLFDLESSIAQDALHCVQPVDVWVKRLAADVGVVDRDASLSKIQRAIPSVCLEHGASPILFNQGLWYVGTHAVEITLELLTSGAVRDWAAPNRASGNG